MTERLEFTVVDAFTGAAFGGNPAAIVVLRKDHGLPDRFLQLFAREMALSETAYTAELSPGRYSLRWFTPTVEVDLCGHATLACAHHLFEAHADLADVIFETKSGDLRATKIGGDIELTFPEEKVNAAPTPAGLAAACGLAASEIITYFGKNRMDWVVVIPGGASAIRRLKPNMAALEAFPARLVNVTSLADGTEKQAGIDFVSRVFGPAVGVPEDPVTGSAHCGLAPYWAEQLGRPVVRGFQASARGGEVHCTVGGGKVRLRGQAVTVSRGELVQPTAALLAKL